MNFCVQPERNAVFPRPSRSPQMSLRFCAQGSECEYCHGNHSKARAGAAGAGFGSLEPEDVSVGCLVLAFLCSQLFPSRGAQIYQAGLAVLGVAKASLAIRRGCQSSKNLWIAKGSCMSVVVCQTNLARHRVHQALSGVLLAD